MVAAPAEGGKATQPVAAAVATPPASTSPSEASTSALPPVQGHGDAKGPAALPAIASSASDVLTDEQGIETYEALKARADRLEQRLSLVTTAGRRRMAPAVRDPDIPPTSLLANALRSDGGGAQLASTAAQHVPLTLQLMLPLLLLGILFGIFSMIAFALEYRPGRSSSKAGHRRTASGSSSMSPEEDSSGRSSFSAGAYTSPRRGFSYSASWSQGLVEEGGVSARPNATGGGAQGGANSFTLPPSFVHMQPERRSPARTTVPRGGEAVDV